MHQEEVTLNAGARSAQAYLAAPEEGGPGVLVLHAWWGLNPFFKHLCDRLAQAGFVALAPDLAQGQVAQTIDEAKELESSSDDELREQTTLAAARYLLAHPRRRGSQIGVIGFSMGAWWSLQVALAHPDGVAAVVLYYGAISPDYTDYAQHKAAFLGHFGENDEWEPLDTVREMEQGMHAAGRDAAIHVYPGAGHWFVEEDRPAVYHPESATLAWERTLAFLHAHLG